MKVTFTVPGQPVGKQRPRFSRAGNHVRAYTPEKTVNYETLVRVEYERQCNGFRFSDDAQLDMRIMAWFQIPKSASKKRRQAMEERRVRPTTKPDSTNIAKAIEDGLNGVAYHDDAQIVDTMIRRFYGAEPRVVVTIQEVTG